MYVVSITGPTRSALVPSLALALRAREVRACQTSFLTFGEPEHGSSQNKPVIKKHPLGVFLLLGPLGLEPRTKGL
jgi:hypothetical protein